MKFRSTKARPPHLGPYPLERLVRGEGYDVVPPSVPLSFSDAPKHSLIHAMRDFQAMMDILRAGPVNGARATISDDLLERSNHIKAFGYFCDAAMIGIGPLRDQLRSQPPRQNPDCARLADQLLNGQAKSFANGIDAVMADLREGLTGTYGDITNHRHVITVLIDWTRDPHPNEAGFDWIDGTQRHRACLRATEVAVVLANYIRLLGWDATAHTSTSSAVDLNAATVAAGLGVQHDGVLQVPILGRRFGVAVITTDLPLAHDAPLAPMAAQPAVARRGVDHWHGSQKNGNMRDPYLRRDFAAGPHPFERLRRVDTPTTYIDEPNIPRVPKRTDMFARALFGDMGPTVQKAATGGKYVRKTPYSMAQRRVLAALVPLQNGPASDASHTMPPDQAAAGLRAISYYLGADAVGTSRCPDWAWYSHDATGAPISAPHDQALSMVIDQGYETMEGASGDDWIAVSQSMRAYLRFSLIGGVIAAHIRNLGYSAKAHTVMDGDVLQPPLLLLSGLGEVSRIGEVILNPYLGPRLKSGAVTTDMPLAHDRPIDFGLQRFCEACNKCARECPSGAITAGPKRMFNGYEIWKSDSQKCTTYRVTNAKGAMCGRCMKTCPWNLEGIFAEAPFRWAAMNVPKLAPALARLDDMVGNGRINPVKKWWWDLEIDGSGGYAPTQSGTNRRDIQPDLKITEQTLAVYPANLAPPPWPYPYPMDREAGIKAYQNLLSAADYRRRIAAGDRAHLHQTVVPDEMPVTEVYVTRADNMGGGIMLYEFGRKDGGDLPDWTAGAHIDVVIAPEFLRQYSLMGDPADKKRYTIAVLRETDGRGGSDLMHRVFAVGRRVFVSKPINHFALEPAERSILLGGGIGVTPMIAFAHELFATGKSFDLHYSVRSMDQAALWPIIAAQPWARSAHLHVTSDGTRADLDAIIQAGAQIYACGSDGYMRAVQDIARAKGLPEAAVKVEYFAAPEVPDYVNHPFMLRLPDGQTVLVKADETAAEALITAGVHVDLKCSDGLCGVCKCQVKSGRVEHRDFVLSAAERETAMILCQSRAAEDGGVLEIIP